MKLETEAYPIDLICFALICREGAKWNERVDFRACRIYLAYWAFILGFIFILNHFKDFHLGSVCFSSLICEN